MSLKTKWLLKVDWDAGNYYFFDFELLIKIKNR